MEKINFKKKLKYFYNASDKKAGIVDIATMNFLMIDGEGDPNISQDYQDAIETLYALSYALKFMIKKGSSAIDYGVLPLEGLWWVDDMSKFSINNKKNWKWTSMIMQPQYITNELFNKAVEQVKKRVSKLYLRLDLRSLQKENQLK